MRPDYGEQCILLYHNNSISTHAIFNDIKWSHFISTVYWIFYSLWFTIDMLCDAYVWKMKIVHGSVYIIWHWKPLLNLNNLKKKKKFMFLIRSKSIEYGSTFKSFNVVKTVKLDCYHSKQLVRSCLLCFIRLSKSKQTNIEHRKQDITKFQYLLQNLRAERGKIHSISSDKRKRRRRKNMSRLVKWREQEIMAYHSISFLCFGTIESVVIHQLVM